MQVVKIETGFGTKDISTFGKEVARFTYEDGQASYVAVQAFPDVETMVNDTTNFGANPMINFFIAAARGRDSIEGRAGATVTEWKQIFSL